MPEERAPATHFVSSARATLSPVPGRKVFNLASPAQEEKEVEVEKKEEVQESGIVETSIKASSVIKQFETRKISKIKPDEEVFAGEFNVWHWASDEKGLRPYWAVVVVVVSWQQGWLVGRWFRQDQFPPSAPSWSLLPAQQCNGRGLGPEKWV